MAGMGNLTLLDLSLDSQDVSALSQHGRKWFGPFSCDDTCPFSIIGKR